MANVITFKGSNDSLTLIGTDGDRGIYKFATGQIVRLSAKQIKKQFN